MKKVKPEAALPNNVISFPEEKIYKVHKTPRNYQKKLAEHKINYVDFIIQKNMTMLYNQLGMDGFDIGSDEFMRDFSYSVEVLKSALYRTIDLPHPIQTFIDKNIDMFEPKDEEQD